MSELLKINVNDHVEKKGNLTYLSWAWAWAEVLKVDPGARWTAHEWDNNPVMYLRNGTAMVKVSVEIKGDIKTCILPVMDNRNKPIVGPSSFATNTAMQRALVKAIALHGLGLYLYAGEDLPLAETPEPVPVFDYAAWLKSDVRPRAEQGQATLLAYLKTAPAAGRDALRADRATWAAVLKVAKAADVVGPDPETLSDVMGGAA